MPGTVVFIFDDGYASAYSHVAPAFETRGLRAGFAVGSKMRFSGMSETQLYELQSRGHEILNHGRTHQNIGSPDSNSNLARDEIITSQDELGLLELSVESYVSANSVMAEKHIADFLAPSHFSGYTVYRGEASGEDALLPSPVDRYRMSRASLFLVGVDGAKQCIDAAIAADGVVVLYDHDPLRAGYANSMTMAELEQVLDYCVSTGISVKLPTQMVADLYPQEYAAFRQEKVWQASIRRSTINIIPDPEMLSVGASGTSWRYFSSASGQITVSGASDKSLTPSRTVFLRNARPQAGKGAFALRNDLAVFTERGQRLGPVCFSVEVSSLTPLVNENFRMQLDIYIRNAANASQIVQSASSGPIYVDAYKRRYSAVIAPLAQSFDLRIDLSFVMTPINTSGANADITISSPRLDRGVAPAR
ncbi:hypothetical protein MAJJADAN_00043 [Pseudomonas phage Amjad_SA]|nr:hypothetical protein MAJJADAN_00043 [Pseudomonas phage Amjad_SA]